MKNNEYVFGENSQLVKQLKIAACFGASDIAKSEIGYAFSNSNPDMNSLKFNKKGEELKKMLSEKKEALQKQYDDIEAQKAVIKAKLVEAGVEFKKNIGDDYDQAVYNYDSTSEEIRNLCYQYNSNYICERLMKEIKTCQALIDNLDEKKTYNLSTPQLLSLQKAMEFDIIKGGEGSKGGKVIGHTESGKPVYSHFNHPNHKDFTKQDHEDAGFLHANLSLKQNPHDRDFIPEAKQKKIEHHDEQSDKHFEASEEKESKVEKAEISEDLQKAYETLGLNIEKEA